MADLEPSIAAYVEATRRRTWRRAAPVALLALSLAATLALALLVRMRAESSDPWSSNLFLQELERGHEQFRDGEYGRAYATYSRLREAVPETAVLETSIASVHAQFGDFGAALPHAAAAERLEPHDAGLIAFHGWVLFSAGRYDDAAARVQRLRDLEPRDASAAGWMARLFMLHDELEEELRAATAGLAFQPDDPDLLAHRIEALVALDRLEEARTMVAGLSRYQRDDPLLRFPLARFRMRTDPAAATGPLLAGWTELDWGDEHMRLLAQAAERAGALGVVRRRIETFLFAPDTPGDAWLPAAPWFGDRELAAILDRYLAQRTEAAPALLRLGLYDPWTEWEEIRAVSDRARRLEHRLAPELDLYYFISGFPHQSVAEEAAALEAHVAEAPHHRPCVLHHARLMAMLEPAAMPPRLTALREWAAGDPEILALLRVFDAQARWALGQGRSALDLIAGLGPYAAETYAYAGEVDLAVVEAAFHAGRQSPLEERLRRLRARTGDAASVAAALVLRWSEQFARRQPVTYGEDVEDYLARYGDEVASWGASSHAIFAAAGRLAPDAARARVQPELRDVFDLVALLERAGEDGEFDRIELERIAGSPHQHFFAPTIARELLRRGGDGTS